MNNKENPPTNEYSQLLLELMSGYDQVTEEDIADLKKEMRPEYIEAFENFLPELTTKLVVMHKLEETKLNRFFDAFINTKSVGYVPSLHDVSELLRVLVFYTNSEKYNYIRNKLSEANS